MKLNYDCLRRLMLEIEDFENIDENLRYNHLSFADVVKTLPEFQENEIMYVTLKAKEGGLLNVNVFNADNSVYSCSYSSLTFAGHQFLDNVRNKDIWTKTKSIAQKIGCTSLKSLISISEKVIFSIIQSQF